MKKYFSIGEVSKFKAVSVKSLRYYGQLGILPPAFVDPESGYRYYSSDQLVIVDLIKVCLDLDIPLKNFRSYIEPDGSVDVGKLLQDAETIVSEKEKKLRSSIAFLDTMSRHIMRTNKVREKKDAFVQHIPQRYFLTAPLRANVAEYSEISANYTTLFRQCQSLEIPDCFNQGVLLSRRGASVTAEVFVEIPYPDVPAANLHTIPGGSYSCRVFEDKSWANCLAGLPQKPLIVKELFDLNFDMQIPLVEVQEPVDFIEL